MSINELTSIVADNKEWIFSGVGVFFIGLLVNRLMVNNKKEKNYDRYESIKGDRNIRFGNNVNIEKFVVNSEVPNQGDVPQIKHATNNVEKGCTHLKIDSPGQGEIIERQPGETIPVIRSVKGRVANYTEEDLKNLQLRVIISILTDKWYLQGITKVIDKNWEIEVHYGGLAYSGEAEHPFRRKMNTCPALGIAQ